MSGYESVSKVYDSVTNDSAKLFVPFILNSIKKYRSESQSLLELGCGTGNILVELSKKYETYGLDLSPEMLEIAGKKDKKSVYKHRDMTDFDFGRKFDAICCMYDSINHLTSLNHWKRMFDCCFRHLVDGGLLIFDFNTLYKFSLLDMKGPTYFKAGKDFVLLENSAKKDRCTWHFNIFKKEKDVYKLFSEDIIERSYEFSKIKEKLKDFKIIEFVDEGGKKPSSKTTRVFAVCRK
ncbi:methyltransferase domain-containing protein [archaeon]|nr:methyltransferase domain-containing protein [archaeon]